MHTWHWQTWQGRSYLTCSLLKDWPHGFFTQQFSPRSPFELVEALHPAATVYRVKQVHGDRVLSASEIARSQRAGSSEAGETDRATFPDADGLFTEADQQAVWVCTADCTPVLIADEATGQVAAVHAGWRGTALGIVQKAVARLLTQGSQPKNLRIAMGPAIAGEVYQVSTTVAAQVGATIVRQPVGVAIPPVSGLDQLDGLDAIEPAETILDTLRQMPDSPLGDDPVPGKARLDVRRVNQLQLEQIGIAPEQIAIAPYCTYQTPDLFFSYRRERQKKVQWSGIVSSN